MIIESIFQNAEQPFQTFGHVKICKLVCLIRAVAINTCDSEVNYEMIRCPLFLDYILHDRQILINAILKRNESFAFMLYTLAVIERSQMIEWNAYSPDRIDLNAQQDI